MPPAVAQLLLIFCLGCGSNNPADVMPTLYPVTGKVIKNGRHVASGAIRFHTDKSQEAILVTGAVSDDGRFTLATRKGSRTAPGAPAGKYQIVYTPPITKQNSSQRFSRLSSR